ncbi:hypothetical protein LBW94_033650 [Nocardia sp. alder85J]|nr:hypothetical protein [Nocardia sp. alder85J]
MVHVAAAVGTDIDDLDKWVDQHVDYHRDHPEFLRLLMWEALELGQEGASAGETRAGRYLEKKTKVDSAQRRGLIRPDLPPGHLLMLLMSLINYPSAVPQVRGFLLGPDGDPEQARAVVKDAVRRIAAPGDRPTGDNG